MGLQGARAGACLDRPRFLRHRRISGGIAVRVGAGHPRLGVPGRAAGEVGGVFFHPVGPGGAAGGEEGEVAGGGKPPGVLQNLLARRGSWSFPMIGKKFPMVGKFGAVFQRLEKFFGSFPMIGKIFQEATKGTKIAGGMREERGREATRTGRKPLRGREGAWRVDGGRQLGEVETTFEWGATQAGGG